MRHLLFACSLSMVLPATIQAQIIREPVSLTAPVGQSAPHLSQEADGPDAAQAAEVHHVSERLLEFAAWGHTKRIGLPRDYRFQASPRIVQPRNPLAFGMPLENRGAQQPPQAGRERSTRRKVFGAIVGGVGGFFGGMFLGAAIEGDRCNCDDPGLLGALIGAPVGGVAGGVLGYKVLF